MLHALPTLALVPDIVCPSHVVMPCRLARQCRCQVPTQAPSGMCGVEPEPRGCGPSLALSDRVMVRRCQDWRELLDRHLRARAAIRHSAPIRPNPKPHMYVPRGAAFVVTIRAGKEAEALLWWTYLHSMGSSTIRS